MTFLSASRKPGFIPFGLFNPVDANWLAVVIGYPSAAPTSSTVTLASITGTSNTVIDTSIAQIISIFLSSNVNTSSLTFSGGVPPLGLETTLRIIQNGVGGWTFAFPSNLVVDSGFFVDPDPNRVTVIPIVWNGTNWIFRGQGFSVPAP